MKLKLLNSILGGCFLFFTACNNDDDSQSNNNLACTAEFRMVSIEVVGDSLTDFFTYHSATGDTIRHNDSFLPFQMTYLVLTDNSKSIILDSDSTSFVFKGFIDDSMVVNEPFEIGANRCHIFKISGRSKIVL